MTAGKKGAQLQLQTEINSDEEWGKMVEKEGLIGSYHAMSFHFYAEFNTVM